MSLGVAGFPRFYTPQARAAGATAKGLLQMPTKPENPTRPSRQRAAVATTPEPATETRAAAPQKSAGQHHKTTSLGSAPAPPPAAVPAAAASSWIVARFGHFISAPPRRK